MFFSVCHPFNHNRFYRRQWEFQTARFIVGSQPSDDGAPSAFDCASTPRGGYYWSNTTTAAI